MNSKKMSSMPLKKDLNGLIKLKVKEFGASIDVVVE